MRHMSRRDYLKFAGLGALAHSTGCTASLSGRRKETDRMALVEPSEKREFTDPESGRTIWQLTDGKLESKHSYYDLCPWSYDGRFLVVSSVDPSLLKEGNEGPFGAALTSREALVRVIDTSDWTIRTVARHTSYNSHTGAFAMWHPKRNSVFFNRADNQVGILDVDSGEAGLFAGGLRQLAPDGSMMVYFGNTEELASEQYDARTTRSVTVLVAATDGSGSHDVVTKRALYEVTPNREEFTLEEMTIGNTKWRPDSASILLANFIHSKPNVKRSLYIVEKDGSEVRWLCHYGHHHSWTSDGNSILFYDWVSGSGWRLMLVDFDGSNRRMLIDRPLGSHPLMAADGNRVVDWDDKGIVLLRIQEQTVERIVTFRNKFRMDIAGTHPHAVWDAEGTQVLYNSAETGQSEVYLIQNVT